MTSSIKSLQLSDGTVIELKRLTLDDLISLGDDMRADKVAAAQRVMKTEGVKIEQATDILASAETLEFGVGDIWEACVSPRMARKVILKGLNRAGKADLMARVLEHFDDAGAAVKVARDLIIADAPAKEPKDTKGKKAAKAEEPADTGKNPI